MREGPPQLNNTTPEKEVSLEKKAVMEKAHTERLNIISGSFQRLWDETMGKLPPPARTSLSMALNQIPGISHLKMTGEAAIGKTLSGKELSNSDRILQLIAAITSALAWFLAGYTVGEKSWAAGVGSAAAGTVSWITYSYVIQDEVFDVAKETSGKHKDKFPKVHEFFQKVEKFKEDLKKFLTIKKPLEQ
jgi:hypothetical protein